jgi:hypothetical protein
MPGGRCQGNGEPLGQAGPEIELVLAGVVDRLDAIGSWRQ